MPFYTSPISSSFSATSANGINSDTVISGGNWSVDTYTGQGEQNAYAYVGVNLQVDEDGTLFFDFSQDGTNWSSYPIAGFTVNSGINEVHTAWKGNRYFRARFVGTGGRTYFRLQTYYSNHPLPLSTPINQALSSDQDATPVRAFLAGQTPAGVPNTVELSPLNKLEVEINEPITAFGDLRVAEISPQFQGSFEYTVDNTELNTNTEIAGGTVTQADAMAVLNTSTTTASIANLESRFHARYRAGLGGLCRFTALFTTGTATTYQIAGLGDELGASAPFKNGYAVGYNGTDFGVFRFQNDSIAEFVALSACDDPLDGTGRTGMTLDPTNLNVFQIQYGYLGAHDIVFFVEDILTGRLIPFHQMHYAGENTTPSVYNPNFHFQLFVDNQATTDDLTLKCASYAYFVEGRTKYFEVHQPEQSTGERQKLTVTSEVAILTIRNKSTYASKTNFVDIALELLSTSIESTATNNLGSVRLVKNATLGGSPSYTDINATNSVVEIDVAGTTVSNGVTLPVIPLAGKNDKENLSLTEFDIILHPGETITVAGSSANSATINASLLWKELF